MKSLLQFECDAHNIALNLREQFKRTRVCLKTTQFGPLWLTRWEWAEGWITDGDEVDRFVSWDDGGVFRTVSLPGRQVLFVQPIRVSLSTTDQLHSAGVAAPAVIAASEIYVEFDLRVTAGATAVSLVFTYKDILGLPDLPELQTLKEQIAGMFPPQTIPLDVGSLTGLGGSPPVANVGIALWQLAPPAAKILDDGLAVRTPGSSFVILRVQIASSPPTSIDDWATFFTTPVRALSWVDWNNPDSERLYSTPGAEDAGWALFIDQYFVVEQVRQGLEKSFQGSGKFRVEGGVAASWSAPAGRAIVTADFFGTAVDACDQGIFGSSDIDLQVSVPVEISAWPSTLSPGPHKPYDEYLPGVMQQAIKVNYWKSDWDTFLCLATTTVIWPYLGARLMESNDLTWLQYLGSLIIGADVFFFALGKANQGGQLPSPGPDCAQPDSGKDEFVCTMPFDPGSVSIGGMPQLMGHYGRPEGLVLYGNMYWHGRLGRGCYLASVTIKPFSVAPVHFSCRQIGSAGLGRITESPADFAGYSATVALTFEPNELETNNDSLRVSVSTLAKDLIPPYVCSVSILPEDDPLNVFAPRVKLDDGDPMYPTITVTVPLSQIPAAYFSAQYQYPCRLVIQSSAGTRIITLPAISKADADAVKASVLNAWAATVSQCYAKSRSFDPRWRVDPSDYFPEWHSWEAVISGLRPGEAVSLRNPAGAEVATARANGRGTASLRALLSPAEDGGQLGVRRGSPAAPLHQLRSQETDENSGAIPTEEFVRIDLKQTQFLLQAELEVGTPVLETVAFRLGNRPALLVVGRTQVTAYDLSRPSYPAAVARRELTGLSGALATGGRVMAWGTCGVVALQVDTDAREVKLTPLAPGPVLGLASLGSQVFVLRPDGLQSIGGRQDCPAPVKPPHGLLLAATSQLLIVGSDRGIALYRASGEQSLGLVGQHPFEGLSRIVAPPLGGRDDEILLEGTSMSERLDISEPARVTSLGITPGPPPPATVRRHGDLLVEAGATSLRIYTIGRVVLL